MLQIVCPIWLIMGIQAFPFKTKQQVQMNAFISIAWCCTRISWNISDLVINVHPCEKVIGMFFHNQIWSRLLHMIRLCLVCIKRSIEEVTKCQISKRGYYQGRSDEIFKKARCQICDVKFGHRIMEAVVFFDQKMHNFIQITFNFTNMWSKDVISWFSDIILHE